MVRLHRPSHPIHWSWVSQLGPDAQDFLHRLTTVNVRALQPGEGARGCFLTPQGKIRAYFQLWNYGPAEYAFELDAGPSGEFKRELLAAIDQFTFGEKFQLADVSSLACAWILADEGSVLPDALAGLKPLTTVALDEGIRLCHQGDADYGRPWITAWAMPDRLDAWLGATLPGASDASFETLESWRIAAVRPRPGAEIQESTIPLEAGLKDAIAENKGCYPGQEVIERIVALGAPARRLARIDGIGAAPRPGDKVLSLAEPPTEVGEVTSVTAAGESYQALGFVRKIHSKEGLEVRFATGSKAKIARVAPYA